ncbi:tigger transposable element-derived protein 1-like [Macrobrachium nipponense]|uniref:tigger transposable element-derived protein 1-like n=1 Tax=Macrobrachium nipponense TaxID=159736 RepID=UPI0030C8560D
MTFYGTAKAVSTVRDKTIVKMESALAFWIKDCRKKNVPLDSNIIRQKARQIYQQLSTPTASQGDKEAAAKYPQAFMKIIQEKGYRPEQVFNMDGTGLFWKKMSSRTYLMKDEAKASGFKAQKDRVTLLMCGNAAGFILKPGLINKAANSRALKNKNKALLPVFWMHNPKAWITKVLTEYWFHQSFIPQVRQYLADLDINFKVLLIKDNASGYPLDLYSKGVQLEFLPPNTTSLLQPMDQGVIRAFKALYTGNSLQHLVDAMDRNSEFTLKDYWRKFTIATCLSVIDRSLKDMKKETLNACWTIRPIPHSDDLPVPTPPANKDLLPSSDEEMPLGEGSAKSVSTEGNVSVYSGASGNEPYWIT